MHPYRKRFLMAGALAACGAAAFAQPVSTVPFERGNGPQAQQQRPGRDGMGPRGGRLDPAQMQQRMAERHARRMEQLKTKLKITPAQEGAWTTFTSAMQPPAMEGRPRFDRDAMARMTTPQRIDFMEQMQTERAARMRQRGEAVKAFYSQLTPYQQGLFDADGMGHFGPHDGPGGPGGPGGHHRHGGGQRMGPGGQGGPGMGGPGGPGMGGPGGPGQGPGMGAPAR